MKTTSITCPHCITAIFVQFSFDDLGRDADGDWGLERATCPSCGRLILVLQRGRAFSVRGVTQSIDADISFVVHPRASGRKPCPSQVTEPLAADYKEACLVLAESPKASSALSRRCLQALLREKADVEPSNLADEIQQVLDARSLPSYLADSLDTIRNIGNFAAHPTKSKTTGEIVPVEPGEAEWNLDVLEGLFDFYFVQPNLLEKKREALNRKLADVGKPPVKGSRSANPEE